MALPIKKIKRDICLITFRNLPLSAYDKKNDSDVFYYPDLVAVYWMKIEDDKAKVLIEQLINLFELLNFEKFIFMNTQNKAWISKLTKKRKDFKPLIKTVNYFKSIQVGTSYNGGLEVKRRKMLEFLPHFYRITRADSGFFEYHFTDIHQNIIFYLHYSGQLKVMFLNKVIQEKFNLAIIKTKFVDTLSERADRF
jgi:hypothetical protein